MYGTVDGRAVTVDALSWAWEHWADVATMDNPIGYLFRVGQSASRRYRTRAVPVAEPEPDGARDREPDVELVEALSALSGQQRTAALLVHGFGWTLREVAELLEINPSSVRVHLERAMTQLRRRLEGPDG
jgi:RNA polymerase sigma factor (sigma-70 family)